MRGRTPEGKWVQREIQVFEEGQKQVKDKDDDRYRKLRLLTAPGGRLPLVYVLWGAVLNSDIYHKIRSSAYKD